MTQLNLLPDVKIAYIKARRLQRTVILLAGMVSAAMLMLLVLLFIGVVVLQKKHLNDLSADIKTRSSKLQAVDGLDKILTVQNQLNSLSALHDLKPESSRMFTYLEQVTPVKATVSGLTIQFEDQTIALQGSTDSLETLNKFIDTLKFTTYRTSADTTDTKAFSQVVLASFSRDDTGTKYEINLKYDAALFDVKSPVALTVPKDLITTRSETEKPAALFKGSTQSAGGQ